MRDGFVRALVLAAGLINAGILDGSRRLNIDIWSVVGDSGRGNSIPAEFNPPSVGTMALAGVDPSHPWW
jgi:hypothetical protein